MTIDWDRAWLCIFTVFIAAGSGLVRTVIANQGFRRRKVTDSVVDLGWVQDILVGVVVGFIGYFALKPTSHDTALYVGLTAGIGPASLLKVLLTKAQPYLGLAKIMVELQKSGQLDNLLEVASKSETILPPGARVPGGTATNSGLKDELKSGGSPVIEVDPSD